MKTNKVSLRKLIMLTLLCAMLIFFDQFIKVLVLNNLKGRFPVVLINDVLEFTFVGNKGIAWGMLWGKINFVVIFTLIITLAILILIVRLEIINNYLNKFVNKEDNVDAITNDNANYFKLAKKYSILQILLVFLASGAIGNLIDRIRLGYVVDFIYFKLIDFPVFNIADIYVTCTIIILVIFFIFILSEEDFSKIYTKVKNWHKGEIKDDSK